MTSEEENKRETFHNSLHNKRLATSWLAKQLNLINSVEQKTKDKLSQEFIILDGDLCRSEWRDYETCLFNGSNPYRFDFIFYYCDAVILAKKLETPLESLVLKY